MKQSHGIAIDNAIWLMRHTVPVPGERGAAVESWMNVLADLGLGREEIEREVERARSRWDEHPWRHTDGGRAR